MAGERKNHIQQKSDYGTLTMRAYNISGNDINAFYDSSDDLVFVLDNTINERKTNVLLVINPDADKKWDEILSDEYGVDLETIRPKQDNKYQKLDIEYSGLNVYDNLISAFNAGDDLTEELNQLNILRDSAVRHSAMMRLNAANEIISKTNVTIVKTKESIVRLQERIKTLRSRLSATKKEIGRVSTKQSAAKVLKLESQIEATNDKLKRAKKRLETAQKRLEIATVDAELAGDLLKQPAAEIKQVEKNQPLIVAPKHEIEKINAPEQPEDESESEDDYDEDDDVDYDEQESVKPLFNQDPQILNDAIAFKPISFSEPEMPLTAEPRLEITDETKNDSGEADVPMVTNVLTNEPEQQESTVQEYVPMIQPITDAPDESDEKPLVVEQNETKTLVDTIPVPDVSGNSGDVQYDLEIDEADEGFEKGEPVNRPVLETMVPVTEPDKKTENNVSDEQNIVVPDVKPLLPTNNVPQISENQHIDTQQITKQDMKKPTFVYYILLIILIVLSVFTLWLYQKNTNNSIPVLTATVEKTETKTVAPSVKDDESENELVFLDESDVIEKQKLNDAETNIPAPEPTVAEPTAKESMGEPIIEDDVPVNVITAPQEEEPENIMSEEDVLANKPVYEPGAKHDEMFIAENGEEIVSAEPNIVSAEYDVSDVEIDSGVDIDTNADTDNVVEYDAESEYSE